jgi:hypothetical protein
MATSNNKLIPGELYRLDPEFHSNLEVHFEFRVCPVDPRSYEDFVLGYILLDSDILMALSSIDGGMFLYEGEKVKIGGQWLNRLERIS